MSEKDTKNPNEKLRSRNLKDLQMLKHFVYDGRIWESGEIYDPGTGKTYSCTMKLKLSKLEIRGYIGISLFGRTVIWQRTK